MKIQTFTVNPFAENTYLLYNDSGAAVVFDPGFMSSEECRAFDGFVSEQKLQLSRCLQTHCHIDHILGVHYINTKYGLTSELHSLEQSVMESGRQVSSMYGLPYTEGTFAKEHIIENTKITVGNSTCDVLFTPGHSPGSVCFYFEKEGVLIAGDLIFQGSIGRTDLPGGNHETLLESVKKNIFVLPDDTVIYPGHGNPTTVKEEKKYNPFLQAL
jgi:glyoxylase-like metal-dependent hydrolase (beta-lactamase superfamily II)